jgi:hypothetical protein
LPSLAEVIAEAFIAGATLEAKKQAKAAGKKAVVYSLEVAGDAAMVIDSGLDTAEAAAIKVVKKTVKRKPSKYNIAYAKAFKSVAADFKKKNGSWKKDGFKRAGAAARRKMKR